MNPHQPRSFECRRDAREIRRSRKPYALRLNDPCGTSHQLDQGAVCIAEPESAVRVDERNFVAGESGTGCRYVAGPSLRSVAVHGLGPFGLMAQYGLRQPFQTIEQGFRFSILLRSGAKHGHHFGSEFHVDGFAFSLIRPFKVRSMSFGRVLAARALGFAAFHHPLEKCPFAEVLQLLQIPLEILKASRVAIRNRGRLGLSWFAHNCLDTIPVATPKWNGDRSPVGNAVQALFRSRVAATDDPDQQGCDSNQHNPKDDRFPAIAGILVTKLFSYLQTERFLFPDALLILFRKGHGDIIVTSRGWKEMIKVL
jgi:hypothetical protein